MAFQAKIKLGFVKSGPLTHTGFKGRPIAKGESFTTTSLEEAIYYRAQPGFSVTVIKGRLPAQAEPDVEPHHDVEAIEIEADDDDDDDKVEEELKGGYERRDLKKMSREDLVALIKSDDDLPLTVHDVAKKSSKKEIIHLILDAQRAGHEPDE